MTRRSIALLALGSLALAACGIGPDDGPRNIPAADQRQLGVADDPTAGAATGTARVYLLGPDTAGQSQSLVAVARDVEETPSELLGALLAGPNTDELSRQMGTALPGGTQLHSARLQGGVLRVDVSTGVLELSGQVLIAAVAQIVFTGSELTGARSVEIRVDGELQRWPAGNGELQSEPLTVYDYPGLVQSSQPAYPAIPTPSQP